MVWSCYLFSKESSILDFKLGSKYSSSVNHQMIYFINRTFRKSGPRTYRKTEPYPKIHSIGQKHLYGKLEGADIKYENNFLNLKPKIIQGRHCWFQVWKFFVLHKTLLNDLFNGAECTCIWVKNYVPKWPEFQIYLNLPK